MNFKTQKMVQIYNLLREKQFKERSPDAFENTKQEIFVELLLNKI